jgi:hypothetical protein
MAAVLSASCAWAVAQPPAAARPTPLVFACVTDNDAFRLPVGDGSLGLLEGHSSRIDWRGAQPVRWYTRADCNSEVAMASALHGRLAAGQAIRETMQRHLDRWDVECGLGSKIATTFDVIRRDMLPNAAVEFLDR